MIPMQLNIALGGRKTCLHGWELHTPSLFMRKQLLPSALDMRRIFVAKMLLNSRDDFKESTLASILVLIAINVIEIQWTVGIGKGFNKHLASGT